MEENKIVKDYYENKYDEYHRKDRDTLEFTRTKIIISRYLSNKPMKIADICGAAGVYSFWLANMGHKVHLLDLAQNHIDMAKQTSIESGVSLASYSCADARNLPYDNESMDLVLLMGALYHLRSPESRSQCLSEAFRVVKRDGFILCTVICRYMGIASVLKYNILDSFGGIEGLREMISTGVSEQSNLPLNYLHTPAEIRSEMISAGFDNILPIAVEGIGHAMGDNSLPSDEKVATELLQCIELTESIPDLLGISRNIIVVGKKP